MSEAEAVACSTCGSTELWRTPRQKRWLCSRCEPPMPHQEKLAGFVMAGPQPNRAVDTMSTGGPYVTIHHDLFELMRLKLEMETHAAEELVFVRRAVVEGR